MTEYTSLEVSKRLAGAGFDAVPNALWDATGGENDEPIIVSFPRWKDDKNLCRAYRSDTLLDWLMHKPLFSLRTHSVDVKARGVRIVATGECELRLFVTATLGSGKTLEGDAPTLPDALAEVILKVLEVSNG